jgi:succinate dehydrogenase/fumarate reductase cytochrome b subunit
MLQSDTGCFFFFFFLLLPFLPLLLLFLLLFLFKSLATWYELFEESLRLEIEKEKVNGISS